MVTHMTQAATHGDGWFKSSLSGPNHNCVEVRFLPGGSVQVRNSRNREGAVLAFTADEWSCFTGGVRNGEFDLYGNGSHAQRF